MEYCQNEIIKVNAVWGVVMCYVYSGGWVGNARQAGVGKRRRWDKVEDAGIEEEGIGHHTVR